MNGMNVNVGNSLNAMVDNMFRRVGGVVLDLQSGKVALKNADGSIAVLEKGEKDVKLVNVPFNVTMSVPAFAMHTEMDKVKDGDLVLSNRGILGFVLNTEEVEGVENSAYKVLRPNGQISTVIVPTNTVFGKEGVMVVKSFDFGGNGDMNPMMMLALAGDGDIDPMMLMLASGGMKGGDMNPMMMLALAGKGDIDPMMLMLASGGMGDMNPMMMLALTGKLGNTAVAPRQNGNVWRAN